MEAARRPPDAPVVEGGGCYPFGVDPVLYPRLTRYLRSLPRGIESYPDCESKATLYREALRHLATPLDTRGLDPLLAAYIDDPLPVSAWVPEVLNTAVYLAIADQIFKNDEAFLSWVSDFSRRVFEAPMYRILMMVASPERLAKGARRRWDNFHRGIEYDVTVVSGGSESVMRYPPNVYDRLAFRAHLKAIEAAYRATDAKHAVVELISFEPTVAQFRTRWYPESAPR